MASARGMERGMSRPEPQLTFLEHLLAIAASFCWAAFWITDLEGFAGAGGLLTLHLALRALAYEPNERRR